MKQRVFPNLTDAFATLASAAGAGALSLAIIPAVFDSGGRGFFAFALLLGLLMGSVIGLVVLAAARFIPGRPVVKIASGALAGVVVGTFVGGTVSLVAPVAIAIAIAFVAAAVLALRARAAS